MRVCCSLGDQVTQSLIATWGYGDHDQCIPGTNIPRAQMTFIFEGKPLKTRPCPTETNVTWVPGRTSMSAKMLNYKSLP